MGRVEKEAPRCWGGIVSEIKKPKHVLSLSAEAEKARGRER